MLIGAFTWVKKKNEGQRLQEEAGDLDGEVVEEKEKDELFFED